MHEPPKHAGRLSACLLFLVAAGALGGGSETADRPEGKTEVGLIWSEKYLEHVAPGHVERPERLQAIRSALEEAGLWRRLTLIDPSRAPEEALLRVHTREHVERVRRSAQTEGLTWFDGDTYAGPDSYEAALLAAGGACKAVDAVVEGKVRSVFCAVRPPGHHATSGRPMGFCLFNNVAVAARHAQVVHGLKRILIIDWDVHHGNGTQAIFYSDPDVFYISTHQWPHYPGTGAADETGEGKGEGRTLNFPLAAGSGDKEFLAALESGLEQAEAFKPEIIFISAGFDAHRDDPLASLRFSTEVYAEATRRIRRLADRTAGGRVVSVLEGGYNLDALGESVAAHVAALMHP